MGKLSEGYEEEESSLEAEVEAGNQAAEDFAQPGDEDFNEEVLHESIEETIERSKKALSDGSEEADKGKLDDGSKDEEKSKTSGEGKGAEGKSLHAEGKQGLEPPQRVTSDFREWYKTAPPEAQKEFNKIVQDLENGQRQKLREIHEYRQAVEPIFQAVSPWAKDWAERGVSLPQGVALLAKTHERMIENPAKEIARLVQDNEITLDDVEGYINGTAQQNGARSSGTGYDMDISKHPEFQTLRSELESIKKEKEEAQVKLETDKVRALRDEVDESGNKPYEYILAPDFLEYAQPLVSALRTPPRGPDGKFTGGPPMSLVDAYKRAYNTWKLEKGISPQTAATSHQPTNTQPQRRVAEPVSMRPRSAPASAPVSDEDPAKYRHETVEETMNRVMRQMGG